MAYAGKSLSSPAALGITLGLLAGVSPVGAGLIVFAIWWAGAFWYPLVALPSIVVVARRGRSKPAAVFVVSAIVASVPGFLFMMRDSSEDVITLVALGAWSVACLAALLSPLVPSAARERAA